MDWAEAEQLIEIFRQQAETERHAKEMAVANDRFDDDLKKHKLRELKEKEEREQLEQLVEATAAQVAAFHDTLDTYDTATVRALMENQKALDAVRDRIAAMEAAAHRLPDGRVVFKTEDGKHVFDRDGAQLPHDLVDPNSIPDAATRWEAFKGGKDAEHALLQDREKLHAFQHRLDDTREAVDKGHVTAEALAKMDADLRQAMPDAAKAQLRSSIANPSAPDIEQQLPVMRRNAAQGAVPVPAGP